MEKELDIYKRFLLKNQGKIKALSLDIINSNSDESFIKSVHNLNSTLYLITQEAYIESIKNNNKLNRKQKKAIIGEVKKCTKI